MIQIGGQRLPRMPLFLFATEALLFFAVLSGAVVLRFLSWHDASSYMNNWMAIVRLASVVAVAQFSLYYHDLYDAAITCRPNELLFRLLRAMGVACMVLAGIYYVQPQLSLGRGVAVIASCLMLFVLLVWRWLVLNISGRLGSLERVLVLGTGDTGIEVVRQWVNRPELGVKVVGFLDEEGKNIGKSLVNPGIIGAAVDIEPIASNLNVNRVVVSLRERRGGTPVDDLLRLRFSGVVVEDAHTAYERVTGRIMLDRLTPSWFIFSNGFNKSKWLLATKRAIDILISSVALLAISPIMLLVAVAIWIEDGSPVLFRQERVGLRGRTFTMLKFRSMKKEARTPSWTTDGDPRITRVGNFIRKYRLDELPQFVNVLAGEMSLVGPRPEQPYFTSLLAQELPYFNHRHTVRPGITGWAQIKYSYGGSVEGAKAKLEHDLFYIKHLSVGLDLIIVFETCKVMISGRGAR